MISGKGRSYEAEQGSSNGNPTTFSILRSDVFKSDQHQIEHVEIHYCQFKLKVRFINSNDVDAEAKISLLGIPYHYRHHVVRPLFVA